MSRIQEEVIEEIRVLPDHMVEFVSDFVEYLKTQRKKIESFEAKYGSISALESKVASTGHTWEEEKDLFEWQAAVTEIEKIRKILKVEGGN